MEKEVKGLTVKTEGYFLEGKERLEKRDTPRRSRHRFFITTFPRLSSLRRFVLNSLVNLTFL